MRFLKPFIASLLFLFVAGASFPLSATSPTPPAPIRAFVADVEAVGGNPLSPAVNIKLSPEFAVLAKKVEDSVSALIWWDGVRTGFVSCALFVIVVVIVYLLLRRDSTSK